MTDWVVSVGTGDNQLPLIRKAKELGYKVIGLDKKPKIEEVDEYFQISTYDYVEAYSAISKFMDVKSIRGVVARVSGPAVRTQSFLADNLSLPSTGSKIAEMSFSKSVLRQESVKSGVETINGKSFSKGLLMEPHYPSVVKPNQPLFGKKNVYLVNNRMEFELAVQKAAQESFDDQVEIQDYVYGDDIGFLCAFHFGKIIWQFAYQEHVVVQKGQFMGRAVSAPVKKLMLDSIILEAIAKITKNLNISGFVFFCFRMSDMKSFKLYEINPGLCGDKIADEMLPKLWPNYNFFEADIQLSVGKVPNLPDKSSLKKEHYIEL